MAPTFQIRIEGSDLVFPCEGHRSVLDAALQAGIELPYSCRKGVCGHCAGRVTAGEFTCAPTASPEATPEGQVLLCQCSPRSDLQIAPARWRRVAPGERKHYQAKVFRHTRAADDVSLLHLRLPAGQRARFQAGQYLQVTLADGSRRAYSMANAPHESDSLQLHVRHVPGGQFTQVAAQLQAGDVLQVELPFGQCELPEGSTAPLLCVAGGTGFAPVKSLLDDLVKKRIERPVTLVWGARDRAGLYLLEAVQRWQRLLPDFRFIAAVEHEADAAALAGFHGRVDAAVRAAFDSLAGHEVYCCGAPPMVSAVKAVCLDALGLSAEGFFSDVFVPGPAAV